MIRKIGLLVIRNGRILLCRKRYGTPLLILPGGKPEEGESEEEALRREIREELDTLAGTLTWFGMYEDQAAGDSRRVQISLYRGELADDPFPHNEIAELVWFGAGDDAERLSPSLRNQIIPDLIQRGILR